ncbi:DUF5339 family protein [Caviibacterium pharyngocola]|uniref:Lipoprotein n=1 Tax=Caviibacterium pharyngocola TaxID=28159 RepID=A0A2M8RX71_9PAST|nr:DUF5339 family protein [Caviibacterium pharyngocola]PJG83491.1 hypothetical protein CVP04_03740 [Caviibacterium pharyngocola]
MKKLLLIAPLLLSACTMLNPTTEKLSASCQAYFTCIDTNLAKSGLPAETRNSVKQGFDGSKTKLRALSVQQQDKICQTRLALLKQQSKK